MPTLRDPSTTTTAARLERLLTTRILRGDYLPGTRLPTVRALARELEVNASTVQRVLARLDKTGLVTVRHGSGVEVNDPQERGDLSLLPAWILALSSDVERATAKLADFLALRRIIAARLLIDHRHRFGAEETVALSAAAAELEASMGGGAMAVARADCGFARTMLKIIGQSAALALFNSLERALMELPMLAEAMYAEPELNLEGALRVVGLLGSDADPAELVAAIEAEIDAADRRTLSRFRLALEEAA